MKKPGKVIWILLLLALMNYGCSSSSSKSDSGGDQASADAESGDLELDDGNSAGDQAQAGKEQSLDDTLEESLSENNQPVPDNLDDPNSLGDKEQPPAPAPDNSEPPPPAVAEAPSGAPVTVTGLDFKANENGGTVVIKTSAPATYTTRADGKKNQFVVEIQNAVLPKKFQRPYNAKEFTSAIGLIQGYQKKGSSTARIVVQLKEAIEPSVQQEGNSILVMALGQDGAPQAQAEGGETPPSAPADQPADTMDEPAVVGNVDERVLRGRTLDEFLLGTTKFYGRAISIQVKDGDLRDTFNFISEESGLNLVLTDEVNGKISLKLKDIPWDQALVAVMQSKQLGYIRQGNILRIAPLKTIRAETDATKEVIEAQKALQPLRVKVFPVSYAQAKDLEPQIQGFMSGRGKVKSDARTNTLVVNDIPEVIAKVGKLLMSLDTQTPQVLIEGKIVEARDTFSRDIGVQWGYSPKVPQKDSATEINTAGLGTENFAKIGTAVSDAALTVGPIIGINSNWDVLAGTLQLNEKEGTVKVLSSPRVVTLNNIKAQIEQTTEVPIFATTNNNGVLQTTVTYKTAKLQLAVTPQITAEGGVILNVNVTREFFGEKITAGSGAGATEARPLNGRQAQTTVLVNNGETAVIGGIYQSDVADSEQGVPLLRKIPLIGSLFSKTSKIEEKNELLIFLAPRVLNAEKAFGATESGADQEGGAEPTESQGETEQL